MAAPIPMVPGGISPTTPTVQSPGSTGGGDSAGLWGDDGFTFGDLVDVLNPLQHIPVVSWAYRAITGDQIAPGAMAMGGGLYGGLAGFTLGTAQGMIEGNTGKSTGANLVAMFQQDPGPGDLPENTAVAMAAPTAPAAFPGPLPAPAPTGLPLAGQNQPPILTPEQMAVLLASVGGPPLTGQNLAAPPPDNGGFVPGGIGGLAATGNINPMFLPLVPMAGQLPKDPIDDPQDRDGLAPMVEQAADGITGAANVGLEIRALFGL